VLCRFEHAPCSANCFDVTIRSEHLTVFREALAAVLADRLDQSARCLPSKMNRHSDATTPRTTPP
jgi:hypothetical protein